MSDVNLCTAVRKDDYRYNARGIVSNQAPVLKRRRTVGKYAALNMVPGCDLII